MKREEFALSTLIKATSPCDAGRNQEMISKERAVALSGARPCGWNTVMDVDYKGTIISRQQPF